MKISRVGAMAPKIAIRHIHFFGDILPSREYSTKSRRTNWTVRFLGDFEMDENCNFNKYCDNTKK